MTTKQTPDRITRVRREGDVVELALSQTNLRPMDADRLRRELVSWHRPGRPPHIVLSLRGIGEFPGSCVAMLAEVSVSLGRLGGSLVLRDAPPGVVKMLKRSGLSKTLRLARSGPHARRLALAPLKHANRAA